MNIFCYTIQFLTQWDEPLMEWNLHVPLSCWCLPVRCQRDVLENPRFIRWIFRWKAFETSITERISMDFPVPLAWWHRLVPRFWIHVAGSTGSPLYRWSLGHPKVNSRTVIRCEFEYAVQKFSMIQYGTRKPWTLSTQIDQARPSFS